MKTGLLFLLTLILLTACFRVNKFLPDSFDILYTSHTSGPRIIATDINGNTHYKICPDSTQIEQADAFYTSSDGDIIFTSMYSDWSTTYTHYYSIYKYIAQTNEVIMLTDTIKDDHYPCLSSDNKFLIYTSWNDIEKCSNVHMMNMDTKTSKQVTFGHYNYIRAKFSPDNSKIVYSEYTNDSYNDHKGRLTIIDTSSSNSMIIGILDVLFDEFQFSTSGDKVYYYNKHTALRSCAVNGINVETILECNGLTPSICLTNTIDSLIFYTVTDDDKTTLYKINTETKVSTALKSFSNIFELQDVSTDENLFLFETCYPDDAGRVFIYDLTNDLLQCITNTVFYAHTPRFNKYLY